MPITRRDLLGLSLTSTISALLTPTLVSANTPASLYENNIIIDGLGFPGGLSNDESSALNDQELKHVSQSGLTAAHLTVGAVGSMAPLLAFERIVRDIARWDQQIDDHPKVLTRVRDPEDISSAKVSSQTGLIYGLQDGVSFEDDLNRLDALHQLGIRVIQPTYNRLPVCQRPEYTETV